MTTHNKGTIDEYEQQRDFSVTLIKSARQVKIYKVVAGGDESLRSYSEATRGPKQGDEVQGSDWTSVYTQFLASHTLGTVPYRWERGFEQAVLLEIMFQDPIDILIFDGPDLHDGDIPEAVKALAIKRRLQMDPRVPLMEGLGRQNKMALIRETAQEWELIVDHELLKRLKFQERKIARFQRHKTYPITSKWCFEGKSWLAWGDNEVPPIPDLDVQWIETAIQEDIPECTSLEETG